MHRASALVLLATVLGLAGCDQLGIESAAAVAERRDAEGKAIGAGCRHAARSIEDCYANNKRADKAAIFTGWRDMNDYMRENNLAAMPAAPEVEVAEAATEATEPARGEGKADTKADAKADAKADKASRTGARPAARPEPAGTKP